MKWDLGLLADDPSQHRSYQWMMRRGWFKPSFPEDVREELAVWLAMPGFSVNFHLHNLKCQHRDFDRARREWPGYEDLQDKVHENWLSITREDAIKICAMRPGTFGCAVPLVSQLAIMDDLKRGLSQNEVARQFGVTSRYVHSIYKHGLRWSKPLPLGFRLLVGTT